MIRPLQAVKKLIHCGRKGMFSTLAFGQSRLRRPDIFPVLENKAFPEFNPQAEFISAEENPVFLRPDKVQGFPQK